MNALPVPDSLRSFFGLGHPVWPRCQNCGDVRHAALRQTAKFCGASCRKAAWRKARAS